MKERKNFSIWKKTVAVIVLLFSVVAFLLGVKGTVFMIREGFYVVDATDFKNIYLDENMELWGKEILYTYYMEGKESADSIVDGCSLKYVVLEQETTQAFLPQLVKDAEWYRVYTYMRSPGSRFDFNRIEKFSILMMVPKIKTYPDYIACICFVAEHIQLLQWLLPVLAISGLVLGIGSLVYLFCGSGWSTKEQKQTDGVLGFVPTDIFLAFLMAVVIWIGRNLPFTEVMSLDTMLYLAAGVLIVFVGMLSLAARVKSGNIWKNTVLYRVNSIPVKLFEFFKQTVKGIPLIWKTALITFGVCMVELIVCLIFYEYRNYLSHTLALRFFLLWFLEKILLSVILFYWMQSLRELKKAGKELAEGNSNYKVDTHLMFGHAKAHGEH